MKQSALLAILVALCLPLSGCIHAPAFNVLGSYFPAWMLCLFVGILIAVLVSLAVNRFQWQDYLRPTVITYPGIAALATFTLWLTLFN
jgi:uncharacterized membrane protein